MHSLQLLELGTQLVGFPQCLSVKLTKFIQRVHYILKIWSGEIHWLLKLKSLQRTLKVIACQTLQNKLFIFLARWLSTWFLLLSIFFKEISDFRHLILLSLIIHNGFYFSDQNLFNLHANMQPSQLLIDLLIVCLGRLCIGHGLSAVVTGLALSRYENVVLLDIVELVLHLLKLFLQWLILYSHYLQVLLQLFNVFFFVLHFISVPRHLVDWVF